MKRKYDVAWVMISVIQVVVCLVLSLVMMVDALFAAARGDWGEWLMYFAIQTALIGHLPREIPHAALPT